MINPLKKVSGLLPVALSSCLPSMAQTGTHEIQEQKPNILWISTEDMSPHLGCYGDPLAHTPPLEITQWSFALIQRHPFNPYQSSPVRIQKQRRGRGCIRH